MNKRIGLLLMTIWLPLLALLAVVRVSALGIAPTQPSPKFDKALTEILEQETDGELSIIVHLQQRAELTHNLPQEPGPRRAAVVDRLQQTASESQRDVLATLQSMVANGTVSRYRPLWIVNAIIVDGDSSVPYMLARRPEIENITLNARQQFVKPPELQPLNEPTRNWNLEQIRTYQTRNGLGITGAGITVAIMDTGVDWQHPGLRANYRGMQGDGSVRHEGNWHDVIGSSQPSPEPIDPNGHGTHVAGIAVGGQGIGVAPDAQWIAVRTFDAAGVASPGDIHLAFQWLLAPGGNIDLAPDVVNGSWSGDGHLTTFVQDVRALHQAGIVTVFAAGNEGPYAGTVGAPASYPGTIAVAATDSRQKVTWFSSRGPSPVTTIPKPDLAAPGAAIFSALPNEKYGMANGTSMAAPHVAGAAALLLSADASATVDELLAILTHTARPLSAEEHDDAAGWGLLDIYAAVASQMNAGSVEGVVSDGVTPLAGVPVTVTSSSGVTISVRTGDDGSYRAWLNPGSYQLQADAFGYDVVLTGPVEISGAEPVQHDILLQRQPHANVSGQITTVDANQPIADVPVLVPGTLLSTTTNVGGFYTLTLPSAQSYVLSAQKSGYRVLSQTVTLDDGQSLVRDFRLSPAPTILLVDSGHWYYASTIDSLQQALHRAAYAFDSWDVYAPFATPSAQVLMAYDVVIWSAPQDAPGWIGGGNALVEYLDDGGKLFVSGQDVARYDGVSATAHPWFTQYLQGQYRGTPVAPYAVSGVSGTPLARSDFILTTGPSSTALLQPSLVAPREGSLTAPALIYEEEQAPNAAALHAGRCRPYDILFLGFGLDSIVPAPARNALISEAMAYFESPAPSRAIALNPKQTNEVAIPGQQISVTFSLQNLSEVQTTTIELDYESDWTTHLSHSQLELGPCQQQPVTLTLQVPQQLDPGSHEAIELTALADYGAVSGASIVATAPEPILLVADYRWYDRRPAYQQALQDLGLSFDVWNTTIRGSPDGARLAVYSTVLWFTGYDWYQPLTPGEIDSLETYLDEGGRLFLTSQDFLYYHNGSPLARDFLGVVDYQETITASTLLGGSGALAGDDIGPIRLQYSPYRNFSDSLVPRNDSDVFIWNDWGMPAGLATRGEPWRTVFWGAPLELLPEAERALMLGRVLGWMGDLGDSTFHATPRAGPISTPRTYTLTVSNWRFSESRDVTATITLDSRLVLDLSSIEGDISYDATTHQLAWQGTLDAGATHEVTFRVAGDSSGGALVGTNVTATLRHPGSDVVWDRAAWTWFDVPDLAHSRLNVLPGTISSGQRVTYTAVLSNSASVPAPAISATLSLPRGTSAITETLHASDGAVSVQDRRVNWQGALDAHDLVTLTVSARLLGSASTTRFLPAGLVISDAITPPLVVNRAVTVIPNRTWFPLIQDP